MAKPPMVDLGSAGTATMQNGKVTPTTPTAGESLKAGWNTFFDTLASDPDLQQSVLQFGAQLANSPGDNFAADASASLLGATKSFRQAKSNRASNALAAEDRTRDEETRKAELKNTEAKTEKTKAETTAVRKGGSNQKSSDLVRTAEALANTGGAESVDDALVFLQKSKGSVSDEEFVSKYMQLNSLTDRELVGPRALEKLKEFRNIIATTTKEQESKKATESITREDILKVAPDASENRIKQILNNPDALVIVRERLDAM